LGAEEAIALQAHAERMRELALRARIDEEEQAKINAQRREFAAAELAKAARERAKREQELARQAEVRLAAERHAAELAAEAARADQIAEAAALASQARRAGHRPRTAPPRRTRNGGAPGGNGPPRSRTRRHRGTGTTRCRRGDAGRSANHRKRRDGGRGPDRDGGRAIARTDAAVACGRILRGPAAADIGGRDFRSRRRRLAGVVQRLWLACRRCRRRQSRTAHAAPRYQHRRPGGADRPRQRAGGDPGPTLAERAGRLPPRPTCSASRANRGRGESSWACG
jgi:hypothetical protein